MLQKNTAICKTVHCQFLPHENYSDWELQGPCRKNLHYLLKRPVRIAGKPHENYRTYNCHGVFPQYLQPFSIDSADFPCKDPTIYSPPKFSWGKNWQCVNVLDHNLRFRSLHALLIQNMSNCCSYKFDQPISLLFKYIC